MGDPGSLPAMGHYLATTLVALALVIGLAIGTLYLLRRIVPVPSSGRTVRLVESVPLEPRRSLHLVEIGGRLLLLGSTDGSVSLLTELEKGEVEIPEPPPPAARRFIDILRGPRR
jgi:flagellar biosynthetic protein FliO